MIEKLYNQEFMIRKTTETRSHGRPQTTIEDLGPFVGRFNPGNKNITFAEGKKLYLGVDKLYCATSVPLDEGDILLLNDKQYDVVSVKDVFSASHHLEVLVDERK